MAGLLVGLGGCSGSKPPIMTIPGAAIAERSPEGVVVRLEVEADNPNRESMPLGQIRYEVKVDGAVVYAGTREAEATVRGFGKQRFEVPAFFAGVSEVSNFEFVGEVDYIPASVIRQTLYDNGMPYPSAKIEGAGAVAATLPDRPLRAIPSPNSRMRERPAAATAPAAPAGTAAPAGSGAPAEAPK